MKTYKFYKHTNTVTQKAYVGYTAKNVEQRWNEHVIAALEDNINYHFQNAIRKHGIDCWEHELLEEVAFETIKEAHQREILWIETEGTFVDGYNMTKGGAGGNLNSKKTTEEIKLLYTKIHDTIKRNGSRGPAVRKSWFSKSEEERLAINKKRSETIKSKSVKHGLAVSLGIKNRSEESKIITAKIIGDKIKIKYEERRQDVDSWKSYKNEISKRLSKKVNTPMGIFDSLKEAVSVTGIPSTSLRRKLKDKEQEDWYYV